MKSSITKLARGALTLVRGGYRLGKGSPYPLRVALQASGEQGAVRALFPTIAYGPLGKEDVGAARLLLGVRKVPSTSASHSWLRMWGRVFDPNLVFTLKRLGLPTDVAA